MTNKPDSTRAERGSSMPSCTYHREWSDSFGYAGRYVYNFEMLLRPATNSDLARIREIVYTILEEYGFQSDPTGTDADLNDIEANYFRPGGAFEVIEDQAGAVVGTMGLLPQGDGVVELRKMYLVKELRGQGVGRKMMEHIIARANELGFRRIELETASVLVEAIAMYKRFGFQPVEQVNLTDRCDRIMALDL